jgi:hypothetical protein
MKMRHSKDNALLSSRLLLNTARLAAVAWIVATLAVVGRAQAPSQGPFTLTGEMATARSAHTATLLDNGTVLLAGGWGEGFTPLDSAELYHPATGKFTPTGHMTTPRAWATATLLLDGTVLIVGGAQDLSAELHAGHRA